MVGFARARVERLIRDAGARRVSAGAIDRLNEILTEHGSKLAKGAIAIARHAGRKTVQENDIKVVANL